MTDSGLQLLIMFVVVFIAVVFVGIAEVQREKKTKKPEESFDRLTVKELRRLAKDRGVPKYWLKKKVDLLREIRERAEERGD